MAFLVFAIGRCDWCDWLTNRSRWPYCFCFDPPFWPAVSWTFQCLSLCGSAIVQKSVGPFLNSFKIFIIIYVFLLSAARMMLRDDARVLHPSLLNVNICPLRWPHFLAKLWFIPFLWHDLIGVIINFNYTQRVQLNASPINIQWNRGKIFGSREMRYFTQGWYYTTLTINSWCNDNQKVLLQCNLIYSQKPKQRKRICCEMVAYIFSYWV